VGKKGEKTSLSRKKQALRIVAIGGHIPLIPSGTIFVIGRGEDIGEEDLRVIQKNSSATRFKGKEEGVLKKHKMWARNQEVENPFPAKGGERALAREEE